MNRLKTLRVRFALWTTGLLFAAFALFGLFVYVNTARNLATAVDETLRLIVIQLIAEVETRLGTTVFIDIAIDDPQYSQLHEHGFSMRVLDLNGNLTQEYGPYKELPPAAIDLTVPNPTGEFATIIDPFTEDTVRVYTAPIIDENKIVGTLQVAQNLQSVQRALNTLLISLLISGPLIAITAGGSGYFLAARALAPIDKVTRTAREISASTLLSARLNLPATDDEVGRLVATFDSMLARLDDAFRRERQFTADASHELRTPLAAMQTIIGTTLARTRAPGEYEQALSDLGQETEQMKTLTEDLLQLARHDNSQRNGNLKFEEIDLSILLKDVLDSLRPLAEDKGLRLIDNVPDEGLIVMGDSDGLIRLSVNLVGNAIKYTEVGHVTVSAEARDEGVVAITVSDTGVGITPEHLPRIFDRFYRVDEARSKEGSGLGLAIVLTVARAHGGQVSVESTVGKGTTFIVQLATGAVTRV